MIFEAALWVAPFGVTGCADQMQQMFFHLQLSRKQRIERVDAGRIRRVLHVGTGAALAFAVVIARRALFQERGCARAGEAQDRVDPRAPSREPAVAELDHAPEGVDALAAQETGGWGFWTGFG